MDISLFRSRRRTVILAALVGVLLALALGVAMGAFSQSAQAKTRHHAAPARHAVHRAHRASPDPTGAADNESSAGTETDGPGGPNVQSGSQSGPNDQTGGPDTEAKNSGGESSSPNDGPGGANSNCVDNAGCQ